MRTSLCFGMAAAAGLMAWGLSWQVPARAGGAARYADIAHLVSGCYLAECRLVPVERDGDGPAPNYVWHVPWWNEQTSQALLTFTTEGGLQATTTADLGGDDLEDNARFGPSHGTWTQTGNREVSFTRLAFRFDVNGAHDFTWTIVGDVTWLGEDFQEAIGAYTVEAFFPDQDPLDPDEEPAAVYEGTMFLRRINHQ